MDTGPSSGCGEMMEGVGDDVLSPVRRSDPVRFLVLALAVFFFGLGVGLQYNPLLGTLLWVTAGGVATLNVYWMFRSRANAGR